MSYTWLCGCLLPHSPLQMAVYRRRRGVGEGWKRERGGGEGKRQEIEHGEEKMRSGGVT